MAAVTVFVDEAVRGDFPPLCAVSGRPTRGTVVFRHRSGGIPAVGWLLFLLGPVGILAFLVLAAVCRRETLAVQLPLHDEEWQRWHRLVVTQWGLFGSGVAAIAVSFALASSGQGLLWVLIAVGCVLAGGVVGLYGRWRQVAIELDASRRWVTLWRVHPDFDAAVQSRARSDSRVSASAGDLSGR